MIIIIVFDALLKYADSHSLMVVVGTHLQCIYFTNKIWWQCLVPTSTTRLAIDVGYRVAKNEYGYIKEIIYMNDDI